VLFHKTLNSLLLTLSVLLAAACAPAFAPADKDSDGDLDTDESEENPSEIDGAEEDRDESESEYDSDNPFDNGLKFLDKNGQPADLGRQGQVVSDLIIRFKEPQAVRDRLNFDSSLPLFYTLDFGERIQVTFSKFDQTNFEFSEVDISISGLARTGDRPVSCYLENGRNSVEINGVFWVLPGQSGNAAELNVSD